MDAISPTPIVCLSFAKNHTELTIDLRSCRIVAVDSHFFIPFET